MDRKKFNRYGGSKIPVRPGLERSDSVFLKSPPLELDAAQREAVKEAIRQDCIIRGYELFALNVRTNHVHLVVGAGKAPEYMMNRFKSYATRKLRAEGLVGKTDKIWSRHGSTKYLWTDQHIVSAIDYVLYGQGDKLPSFD